MQYKKVKNIYTEDVRLEHNLGANWRMDYYHFHNVYEVYLAVTEGAEFWVGNRQYLLAPNDLLLLTTSDLHRSIIHDRTGYERYILYFNPFYISSMNTSATNLLECFARRSATGSHRISLGPEQAQGLQERFKQLGSLLNRTGYAADVKVKLQLAQILIDLEEITRMKADSPDHPEAAHAAYPLVKPVLDYIAAHYPEALTTDDTARLFGHSRQQLNSLFRDITGLSFHQYLVQFRIVKAKELLESGGMSTTQACMDSGFNDYSHFIRTFKALVGMPPGKYARMAEESRLPGM